MTTDTQSESKPKITEATTVMVETLTPFESSERKRIISAALALLGDGPFAMDGNKSTEAKPANTHSPHESSEVDREFFTRFDHERPSDNALLVAAYIYAKHGTAAFSVEDARRIAESEAGLTVPTRLDMTFGNAARGGKALFSRAGKGQFKVTVHGEKFFRETYGVKKGRSAVGE